MSTSPASIAPKGTQMGKKKKKKKNGKQKGQKRKGGKEQGRRTGKKTRPRTCTYASDTRTFSRTKIDQRKARVS